MSRINRLFFTEFLLLLGEEAEAAFAYLAVHQRLAVYDDVLGCVGRDIVALRFVIFAVSVYVVQGFRQDANPELVASGRDQRAEVTVALDRHTSDGEDIRDVLVGLEISFAVLGYAAVNVFRQLRVDAGQTGQDSRRGRVDVDLPHGGARREVSVVEPGET